MASGDPPPSTSLADPIRHSADTPLTRSDIPDLVKAVMEAMGKTIPEPKGPGKSLLILSARQCRWPFFLCAILRRAER